MKHRELTRMDKRLISEAIQNEYVKVKRRRLSERYIFEEIRRDMNITKSEYETVLDFMEKTGKIRKDGSVSASGFNNIKERMYRLT
ncbi:MAG: hypothetical protein ISS95_01390 [Candidatus Aenigmarchaeota archaeon]|nr:hypothetical protein [Candidatus Aenigmarchaeota archaeon]